MKKSDIDRKGWNWSPVPAEVIMSKELSHADVRVYAYLLWRSGKKGQAWPNTQTIASDLNMSDQAVRISLKNLLKDHWIFRQRRYGSSSVTYVFEHQKDCEKFARSSNRIDDRSANLLDDDRTTGETIIVQPVRRRNDNHRTTDHEQPMGEKTAHPRDLLFDAIVEVCQVDPATSGKSIGTVKAALLKANPSYTPDEVRAFGEQWWSWKERTGPPTIWQLRERIGNVRLNHKSTKEDSIGLVFS